MISNSCWNFCDLRHFRQPSPTAQTLFSRAFGDAREEGDASASLETAYEIGSISKLFVGLAVLKLVEAGRLDLDAPITEYLPEFR